MPYILIIGLFLIVFLMSEKKSEPNRQGAKIKGRDFGTDPNPRKFQTNEKFVKSLLPITREFKQFPEGFLISQLALESNYGKSAPHFNFSGRKARKDKDGNPVEDYFLSWTWEIVKDRNEANKFPEKDTTKDTRLKDGKWRVRVKDYFKAYPDLKSGFMDYIKIFSFPRYAPAFQHKDLQTFAHEIARLGYATAPPEEYAKGVTNTWQKIKRDFV